MTTTMKRLTVWSMLMFFLLPAVVAFSQVSGVMDPTQKKIYFNLEPEGDYSRLTYKIFANKKTYKQGEPILIETMVINDSDGSVTLWPLEQQAFLRLNHFKILDERMEEIAWTRFGKQKCWDIITFSGPFFEKLKPGEKRLLGGIQINACFDMSLPGKYHITSYRSTFMLDQKYEEPLPSNRVTIIVENERFGSHDLKEPGTYDNDTGDTMEEMLKVKEKWTRPRKPDKEQSDPNTEEKEKSKPAETSPTEPEAKPDNPQE